MASQIIVLVAYLHGLYSWASVYDPNQHLIWFPGEKQVTLTSSLRWNIESSTFLEVGKPSEQLTDGSPDHRSLSLSLAVIRSVVNYDPRTGGHLCQSMCQSTQRLQIVTCRSLSIGRMTFFERAKQKTKKSKLNFGIQAWSVKCVVRIVCSHSGSHWALSNLRTLPSSAIFEGELPFGSLYDKPDL